MKFPLNKHYLLSTRDSDSFKTCDREDTVEIPLPPHCGSFGAVRKHDIHTGVDLYCKEGDIVYTIEDGVVVLIENFTGPEAASPWWNPTMAVHIEGKSGVVVYGEIEPCSFVEEGRTISEGTPIGKVKTVLKHDKGRPMTMLHVELYKHGTRHSCIWRPDKPKDPALLDPTDMLYKAFAEL